MYLWHCWILGQLNLREGLAVCYTFSNCIICHRTLAVVVIVNEWVMRHSHCARYRTLPHGIVQCHCNWIHSFNTYTATTALPQKLNLVRFLRQFAVRWRTARHHVALAPQHTCTALKGRSHCTAASSAMRRGFQRCRQVLCTVWTPLEWWTLSDGENNVSIVKCYDYEVCEAITYSV